MKILNAKIIHAMTTRIIKRIKKNGVPLPHPSKICWSCCISITVSFIIGGSIYFFQCKYIYVYILVPNKELRFKEVSSFNQIDEMNIFTNCCMCNNFIMTSSYEPFYCAMKKDTGNIIMANKTTYTDIHNGIKNGVLTGCGVCLVAYRSGNMHRTRQMCINDAEITERVKRYNPDILIKRQPTREANHSTHFTEE